jgi:acetyl/propionyl-CoA carboxylase alpha subunit
VTEMISSTDLIEQQIRVALGEKTDNEAGKDRFLKDDFPFENRRKLIVHVMSRRILF